MTARLSPSRAAVFMIRLYRQTISPLRLPTCRFIPTCSEYAVDALTEFGAIRGGWLVVVRLLKCGPWHNGGWDPIPDRVTDRTEYRGAIAECACAVTEQRTSTVPQGESQSRV